MTTIISVQYRLKPSKRAELLSFVSDTLLNTRKEAGDLAYSHCPCLESEDDMFVFEMWEDLESVKCHINAPHYVEFSKKRRKNLQSYESCTYDAHLRSERHTAPQPD